MDELDDILDIDSKVAYDGKTPPYIKVFAILTLVGSGLYIIKDLFSLAAFSMVNRMANAFPDTPVDDQISRMFSWMYISYIIEGISCIAAILGAIFMLRLKKFGLILYVISYVIYLLGVVTFYMFTIGKAGINEGGIIFGVLYMIIPTGFLIVYLSSTKYFIK